MTESQVDGPGSWMLEKKQDGEIEAVAAAPPGCSAAQEPLKSESRGLLKVRFF